MNLDQHVVRDNILSKSEKNPQPPGARLGVAEPRGNQLKQSDVTIVEAGGRGSKEELSSRDQVGPELWALAQTHISGTRGKQNRGKMGFDKSFVVDAVSHAGGIWCLWDSSVSRVDVLEHDRQIEEDGPFDFLQPGSPTQILGILLMPHGMFRCPGLRFL
ncbi:hypothetical protein Ahy_B05g077838 [Arachis hypogaea]|uniref:Uncharacterized protein n=1 Tax=Arachis hypogaea TaxID=3818 RepID=A0A444Z5P3_ARAHY|nr:hypothetical protein Ahy_B05g077838 [Arachis hypogaea]